MAGYSDTLHSHRQWFNKALFNTDSAGAYFETLAEGIDPMWSLESTKARVEKMYQETADTLTLTVSPSPRFRGFKAGQHLQLSVDINGSRKTRTFSIASCPDEWRHHGKLQLTIKRVEKGQVTGWIHDHLKPGHVIRFSEAFGDFLLPATSTHSLYIAGGSGITPVMSHLRELLTSGFPYPVTLLYYARNRQEFIFRSELEALAKHFPNFTLHLIATRDSQKSRDLSGHLCTEHLKCAAVNAEPEHVFLCGPEPLRQAAEQLVSDTFAKPPAFHQESFGLVIKRGDAAAGVNPVTLSKSHKTIECSNSTPLLEAAEQNGLTPNYGCRMGICYTCKCKKTSGVVRNAVTGKRSGPDEEDIQLCVSIPETPVSLEL